MANIEQERKMANEIFGRAENPKNVAKKIAAISYHQFLLIEQEDPASSVLRENMNRAFKDLSSEEIILVKKYYSNLNK